MAEKATHLLIIDESSEDAEMVTNVLRNAGIAVRAKRIEDDEDLADALDEQRWDLILTRAQLTAYGAKQAIEDLRQANWEIPVIILSNNPDEMSTTEALKIGARDLVPLEDNERLQLVVNRELDNLNERRAGRSYRKALHDAEKRSKSLIDSSRDAIAYVHEGMHIYANPVYLEMFGYADQDEIEGMPIMDMVAPDDHSRFKEFLRSFSKSDKELMGEIDVKGVSATSGEFDASMEFTPATMDGENCTQIIIRQTASKELEEKLKQLSERDLLTGLYNRKHFLEELDTAVTNAIADSVNTALIYFTIDDFESIKQNVGIAQTDILLADIAELLNENIGEPDITARLEGPFFSILLDNGSIENAKKVADMLKHKIADHIFTTGDQSVTLTCSFGICQINEKADSSHVILSRVSHAMNTAQDSGGNSIELHVPEQDKEAGIELSETWIERLNQAIKDDRFKLLYQPIVCLHGDTNESYECFLRMLDENNEEIQPSQFITAAEQANLMQKIDRWVILQAVNVLSTKRAAGTQLVLFVKLSAESITDKTLLPWLSEIIKKSRIPGDSLVFEMSEPVAMTHLTFAKSLVNGLKQLHCKTVVDHFGSGLNSMNILKHLDVDFLKIDGNLIQGLSTNEENQSTVKSLTEMAHAKGKLTMAESVEDANSLAVLWQCGINYIQGYFLSEPSESLDFDFAAGAN